MAADVSHVIDSRRTAEHLAAGDDHATIGQSPAAAAGVSGVHPVGFGILLEGRAGGGDELLGRRLTARFDQGDPTAGILREPGRDHGPGRSASDDDEIEAFRHEWRLDERTPVRGIEPHSNLAKRSPVIS